jgi:hypothetical protein
MSEVDQSCIYAANWRKLFGKSIRETNPDCGSDHLQTGFLFRSMKKAFLDGFESLGSFTLAEVDYEKSIDNERRMLMLASRLNHFIESDAMRKHENREQYMFILETIAKDVNSYFTRVKPDQTAKIMIGMTMSVVFSKLSYDLRDNRDQWSTLDPHEIDFIERFIAIGVGELWEPPNPYILTDLSTEEARERALHMFMDEVASLHSRVDALVLSSKADANVTQAIRSRATARTAPNTSRAPSFRF